MKPTTKGSCALGHPWLNNHYETKLEAAGMHFEIADRRHLATRKLCKRAEVWEAGPLAIQMI